MSLKQYHTNIEDKEVLGIRPYTDKEEKLMKAWRRKNKVLVIDGGKQKRVKIKGV